MEKILKEKDKHGLFLNQIKCSKIIFLFRILRNFYLRIPRKSGNRHIY